MYVIEVCCPEGGAGWLDAAVGATGAGVGAGAQAVTSSTITKRDKNTNRFIVPSPF
jgi:hypothetical protein